MKKKTRPKKGSASKAQPKRRSAASAKPAPIPAGYHTVTPHLVLRRAADAIEFYKKAFGARELVRMPAPDGTVAHAEIRIGDSRIMLGDEMPERGATAPETVGGTATGLFLYVKNVDKAFAQAVAAGATADMPPTDMFWGDRYGKLTDPFGHKWALATHIEDVSPREMARRGAEFMASVGQQGQG
jgi:PhnB protein